MAQHSAQRRRPGRQRRLAFTPPHLNVERAFAVAVETLCERADLRNAGLVCGELLFYGVGGASVLLQREEVVGARALVDVAAGDDVRDTEDGAVHFFHLQALNLGRAQDFFSEQGCGSSRC